MKEASNHKCYTTQPQGKASRFPLQCVTLSLILALLVILGVATFVYAADVSDAGYRGQITVANNGTSNTSVSTVFTLNTQSLIDTNKLNSSANDCAIQTAAGTDVAFMPSVNSTYPWVTWLPTIGEDATLYQYLYTDRVTEGKIRYFPSSEGMRTADNASMEPGENFTIEQSGRVDTDTGTDKWLLYKGGAFGIAIGEPSGNITAGLLGSEEWVLATSHDDPSAEWTNEINAYDDSTGSYATEDVSPGAWSSFLYLYRAQTHCNSLRLWWTEETNNAFDYVDVDAYYNDAWQSAALLNGTPPVAGEGAYYEIGLGGTYSVNGTRVRAHSQAGGMQEFYLHELQFGRDTFGAVTVTATSVSSGELTVRVWADTTNLHISIDSVESDNTTLTANVTDTASDWVYLENDAMPYMEYSRIWVDGVLQQDIEWEYATTFTDQSGNNHDATPTFRTASSDPHVSANLTSFIGIMETTPPPAAGQTGWDILPSVPATPSGFFGEFDPASMTFWGSGYINTFSTATGIPLALIVFPYAFGIAIGAGFIAWYLSSGGGKQHNRGSLLAMAATSLIFMLYFVYGAGGVIPGWILLPFAIEVLVFIVWRQTPSPF